MKKFETVEDLAKAAGELAGGFQKNVEFHKAAAAEHAGMSAYHKGLHDSLDDGHEHKALHKRLSDHHDAMHGLHKAHGETAEKTLKVINDAFGLGESSSAPVTKTAPTTTSGVVDGLVAGMSGDLNALAADMIKTDPAIKELLRKTIADQIAKALGKEIVPDQVRIASPTLPPAPGTVDPAILEKLHLVPRGGSNPGDGVEVSPENEELFAGV